MWCLCEVCLLVGWARGAAGAGWPSLASRELTLCADALGVSLRITDPEFGHAHAAITHSQSYRHH